jgi:hypothetical protein
MMHLEDAFGELSSNNNNNNNNNISFGNVFTNRNDTRNLLYVGLTG